MIAIVIFGIAMLAFAACNSDSGGRDDGDARTDGPDPRGDGQPPRPDLGPDSGPDGVTDGMPDAGPDVGPDGIPDAMPDTLPDGLPDSFPDMFSDASPDGPSDGGSDAGPDAEVILLPPGVADVSHFIIPAPVADLDSITDGRIHAFGGLVPPSLIECDVSGAGEALCEIKASVPTNDTGPTYLTPKSYMKTPAGWSLALLSDPSGSPFDIVRFNEGETYSVGGYARRTGVTIISGSSPIRLDRFFPAGLAYHHTLVPLPEHDRFFIATADPITGMILCFADSYGNWSSAEFPAFASGLGTSALATTTLDLGEGDTDVLVALNSNSPASIDIFDPEDPGTPLIKNILLGETACARLSELALDSTGRIAYVPVESPARRIAAVNLETDEVSFVDLAPVVTSAVKDMVVDGSTGLAYLACADNSISRAGISEPDVRRILLGDLQPQALVLEGGYLYAATERAGEDFARLLKIEPTTAF